MAARLANRRDDEIDCSESAELDDAFFAAAKLIAPSEKTQITVSLGHDVLDCFRPQGKGDQTWMNAVLKAYMQSQRRG